MMRSNPKKKHNISGKWHIRACLLIVTMFLTVTAAGCSKEPLEQAGKPTAAPVEAETATPGPAVVATPEPTVKPTPTPTVSLTPKLTATVTPTPTLMPSSGTAFTPSGTGGRVTFTETLAEVSKAQVGDTVWFGSYEQYNELGAEAIEWIVLDKQDGKLLLLSKYALDAKPYNETLEAVTWETCTLRSWLNGEFYHTAFSQKEQKRILTTKVRNEDNPYWGTEGGNDTEDKVFLLSIGEVLRYFDPDYSAEDPARCAKVTAYAKAQGGYVSSAFSNAGNGWWWLRSPGDSSISAVFVYFFGNVFRSGSLVSTNDNVVRPAFWLNLESETPTPTPTPTLTPTPMPSSGTAFTPSGTGGRVTFTETTAEVSKAQVGDTVRFGSYEQDNNLSNGAEAIEWLVLDKQDGKLLLLSKDALDCKRYNEGWNFVTWEMCTLRSWLNEEFYHTAFSQTEQGRIATTKVKNGDNPMDRTEGGNDTEDKVFLLSIGEALRYFDPDYSAYDPARQVKVTAYAEAQGGFVYKASEAEYYSDTAEDGNSWWWLRSLGFNGDAALVCSSGDVYRGTTVFFYDVVVRPALWLNLESETPTPTPIPTLAPTPMPSSGPVFTPSGTGGCVDFTGKIVELSKAQVGDTVRFGSYEQDNNLSNGAEAIEWLVLDKQDGKLLLLSKDVLDAKPYNEKWEAVTWETCTLRSWLNGIFYNTAFSLTEQGCILTTKVKNEDNSLYGTEGGNDTEDKVFLLSIREVWNYFDQFDPARRAKVTAYAEAQGASVYDGNAWWWLRSPGDAHCAAYVNYDGRLNMIGCIVGIGDDGVRPAFWLNLES